MERTSRENTAELYRRKGRVLRLGLRRQQSSALVRRLVQSGGREGKDLDAVLGDPDGVLELRGKRAVAGDGGPSIGQHFHVRAAEIDHRLNREEHSVIEDGASPRKYDVDNVRLIVK